MSPAKKSPQQFHSPMMLVVLLVAIGVAGLLFSGVVPQLEPVSTNGPVVAEAPSEPVAPVATNPEPAAPEAPVALSEPTFDVVRVEADGATVVAGQAQPRSRVAVVLDGETLAETMADDKGSFAVLLALAPHDGPRVMWLMAAVEDEEMVQSAETVVIAPVQAAAPETDVMALAENTEQAEQSPKQEDAPVQEPTAMPETDTPAVPAVPESATGPEDAGSVSDPAEPGTVAAAAQLEQEAPAQDPQPADVASATGAEAPQLLINEPDGVRVLDAAPLAEGTQIRVDSIDYGAEGNVTLRGQSGSGGTVRASLDGVARAESQADASGQWALTMTDVDAGDHTLTVEQDGPDGQVVARTEMPFQREPGEVVEAALTDQPARIVTVEPGATLWAIARDRYGDGVRYVQVFEANRELIKDPDLIYPGQVFNLPDDLPAAQ